MRIFLPIPQRIALLGLFISCLIGNTGCLIIGGTAMATRVVGQAVNDSESREKVLALRGQPASAADAAFGPRRETLIDLVRPEHKLIVYPPHQEENLRVRYAVELRDEKITALSKHMISDDPKLSRELLTKVRGKTPPECEQLAQVKSTTLLLRSMERDQIVRVYDKSDLLKGARNLVLRFDDNNVCVGVDVVATRGVSDGGEMIKR